MSVARGSGLPDTTGERDAQHNRQRVRQQIVEHLKKHIGEEDIISAPLDKKIKVPIRSGRRYRFIFDRGQGGGVGQGDAEAGEVIGRDQDEASQAGLNPGETLYEVPLDMIAVEEILFAELDLPRLKPKRTVDATVADIKFDDVAPKGPRIDKKATLRRNMARNAMRGQTKIGGFERDDLRYISYRESPKPRTQAVVFCMMDQSGSMDEVKKRTARIFFYWVVSFLRHRYSHVDVVFIGHDAEAQEMSEEEFFSKRESGGTVASSAYHLAQTIQRERFPTSAYNVYLLHASDGDNIASDNPEVFRAVRELTAICSLVGYLEIGQAARSGKLSDVFAKHQDELPAEFLWAAAADEKDIWPALKSFFAREGVEEAVL